MLGYGSIRGSKFGLEVAVPGDCGKIHVRKKKHGRQYDSPDKTAKF
jgi:hypothetical protein